MIDTHSHLFTSQFDEDREAVLEHAKSEGVEKIVLPNIDMDTIEPMLQMSKAHPDLCYSTIGLHPCDVKEDYEEVLAKMESIYVESGLQNQFVGVGETGLDYYWDKTFIDQQKAALRIQCGWAKALKIPIILHTRESTSDCIDIMEAEKTEHLTGVFHCFGGTQDEARRIIELGFSIGIGGTITYKKNDVRSWLSQIDARHIVLETDSPYLAPVPKRGKRNESAYLKYINAELAAIYEISEAEMDDITSSNAMKLFFPA